MRSRARGADVRRGRLLDHFLVPPLHGAVAVAEIDRVAVLVGKDLDFDVARILEIFLDVHRRVAERGLRFGPGGIDRVEKCGFRVHHAHAAAAAAARRLDDHRVTDLAGDLDDFLRLFRQSAVDPRHDRQSGFLHRVLGAHLVAHQAYRLGARPDEHESALLHALGEIRVLREKTIARVYRLGIGHFRGADDRGNVEIACARRRRADAHRFIGELDVLRFGVGLGMHHDGLDAELAARALDAQRDLAAIRYQDLSEH